MLPRLISSHPYFHENLNEEQAKQIVSLEGEGNFLFCKSSGENPNEYFLVCKGLINNLLTIKTIKCTFIAERFGSIIAYCGFESAFSGLEAIVRLVEAHKSSFKPIIPDYNFTPRPIYNSLVKTNRLAFKDNNILPLLPSEVVKIIFQKIDMPSFINTTKVSKSWYTFFNQNFLTTTIKEREKIEEAKIRKDEAKRDAENAHYLANRYHGTGLE